VSFHPTFDPDSWLKDADSTGSDTATVLGASSTVYETLDIEEVFGEGFHTLDYELETRPKNNTSNAEFLEGTGPDIGLEEDGFFYDVEIRELVDEDLGREARHQVDDGLLAVHFTGYRDPNGDDYMVHWDPKKWVPEGTHKYRDSAGEPDVEAGMMDTNNYFSDEDNYRLEDGLETVETQLGELAREDERLGKRWRGLQDAVRGFRSSLEAGKPVNTSSTNQAYADSGT
jgi:hypothetical protein